jgi:hypothetical protein
MCHLMVLLLTAILHYIFCIVLPLLFLFCYFIFNILSHHYNINIGAHTVYSTEVWKVIKYKVFIKSC